MPEVPRCHRVLRACDRELRQPPEEQRAPDSVPEQHGVVRQQEQGGGRKGLHPRIALEDRLRTRPVLSAGSAVCQYAAASGWRSAPSILRSRFASSAENSCSSGSISAVSRCARRAAAPSATPAHNSRPRLYTLALRPGSPAPRSPEGTRWRRKRVTILATFGCVIGAANADGPGTGFSGRLPAMRPPSSRRATVRAPRGSLSLRWHRCQRKRFEARQRSRRNLCRSPSRAGRERRSLASL